MSLFDYVKSHISIWDVAQDYVTLHKAGNYWKARCPFHHEKTASFTISPHKEIFYCFGCHAGGDVISFIQKTENCSPLEAAAFLADRYNLTIPQSISMEPEATASQKNQYHTINATMANWCHDMLHKHPSILRYLEKRGFTQESTKRFLIGYFPGGLQSVQSCIKFMATKGILLQDLLQANILTQGKTIVYSSFEERIIFPIKDHLGRYCGFGGRVVKPDDQRPKYYNSRENEFFNKGSLLFGLDLAKKEIQKKGTALLVEGYTDCIALVQAGYPNTIATLGTSCTLEHLKQLSRLAHTLFIVYDSDRAGQQAVLRLTQLCWQVNLDLQVISLPAGQDPASFILGGNDLAPAITQAQELFSFFLASLGNTFVEKSLGEKLQVTRKFLTIIAELDDSLKQDLLLQRAATTFHIPFESLKKELNRLTKPSRKAIPQIVTQADQQLANSEGNNLEKRLFCAILNNVQLLKNKGLPYIITYLPPSLKRIVDELKVEVESQESFDFNHFFGRLDEKDQQLASRLLLEYEEEPETYPLVLQHLYKKLWKKITVDIQLKIANAKKRGNEEEVVSLVHEFIAIKKHLLPQASSSIQTKREHK